MVVLMAARLTVTMHIQPQNEVEAYKKLLRTKGEKLEISEMCPRSVAPEENSANAVADALRILNSTPGFAPRAMTMVSPGKALVGWSQPDARGYDFTNSWDEFGSRVKAEQPGIELLQQVLQRPRLDFQLDFQEGGQPLGEHLWLIEMAAKQLSAAAIYALHEDDCGSAATNILTQLALVQKDTRDQVVFELLSQGPLGIAAAAVPPTWELLQSTNVTDAQLAAVQNGWQKMNFLCIAEHDVETKRAWALANIQESRASHKGYDQRYHDGGPAVYMDWLGSPSGGGSAWGSRLASATKGLRSAATEALWRSSGSYSAELYVLTNDQIILETVRSMMANQSQFYKKDYDEMLLRSPWPALNYAGASYRDLGIPDFRYYVFFLMDLNPSDDLLEMLQIETGRRVVVTAIALKRFQLKNGKWPATLAGLSPEFLPSVPVDPCDGKPLKYHANSDGTYLLYSVGENGVDDGGDPTNIAPPGFAIRGYTGPLFSRRSWLNPDAHDWVWPQTATPAEAQYFYEHPAKRGW